VPRLSIALVIIRLRIETEPVGVKFRRMYDIFQKGNVKTRALNQRYDIHLLIDLIVLILLPILLGTTNIIIDVYATDLIALGILKFNNPGIILTVLQVIEYIVFVVMMVIYPIYPIFFLEKFMGRGNPKAVIKGYRVSKKIVIGLFPLFILSVALIMTTRISQQNLLSSFVQFFPNPMLASLFITTLGVIFFVVGSTLLRIILLNSDRSFTFYLARTSVDAISEVRDDVDKLRYLITGLNSYNKFIRRNLGLQIGNLKTIYSRIISEDSINRYQLMKELSLSFKECDRLEAVRCLTRYLKIADADQFLSKEPVGNKIGNWLETIVKLTSVFAAISGALITLRIL
jgi:hypothetical protein